MAEDNTNNSAAAIIETVERLAELEIIGNETAIGNELALAVLPGGKEITDLKPYLDKLRAAPERIETAAQATTVDSFIDYLNRFKLGDSAVFCLDDPAKPSLTGIIDFHGGSAKPELPEALENIREASDSTPGSSAIPRFGRHTVQYHFPLSEQVKAWSAISGKGMNHVMLGEFLADHSFDIANPPLDWMQVDRTTVELILHLLNIGDDAGDLDDAAADIEPAYDDDDDRYISRSALYKLRKIRFGSAHRLLQMARTVEIAANAKTVEGYNDKTGERTVQFEEQHETRVRGYKVTVPDAFLLKIPIFEGEAPMLLPVRLQYRRGASGGVLWIMTLVGWERSVRWAVKSEAARVKRDTDLDLFYGARAV